jgi:hypothetical protein
MSQTLVQLIVRNLYERTADVRWWATDDAFYKCLENPTPDAIRHAQHRLGIINRFYTVYLNLALADRTGRVVAVSNPERFAKQLGANVSHSYWFNSAKSTLSGDEYRVDDIYNDELLQQEPVAVYSTAVRRGGELSGEVLGVLGVFFAWGAQARCIVQDEPNLSDEEFKRTRVMLLDSKHRVIAASDGKGLLTHYSLKTDGHQKGFYTDSDGRIVAFAKTIGYEEYDGLGWYGVIEQTPETVSDETL